MTDERFDGGIWDASRPTGLVVCCADGRLQVHIRSMLAEKTEYREKKLYRADLYSVPGGPAPFTQLAGPEGWAAQRAAKLLIEHHQIKTVLLVAHEGCAYYRVLMGEHATADDIAVRQRLDLLGASLWFSRNYDVQVTRVFASVENGKIVFTFSEAA